jgi:hypothetical protein
MRGLAGLGLAFIVTKWLPIGLFLRGRIEA